MLLTAVAIAVLAAAQAGRPQVTSERPSSTTVLGPVNELLAAGATALEQGRVEEGIRLTLDGLKTPSSTRDIAAGHANLCAGYSMLREWDKALPHCNESIKLDPGNWRAYNNRAAVYVGKGRYDRALMDVQAGLDLAPESSTLHRSLEIIYERKRMMRQQTRRPPAALN